MNPILFYCVAAVVLLAAIGVVRSSNIFHAGLSLALSFFGVAAIYVMLDAHFIAAVQVLIYVGAIAVIVMFAVMLTQHISDREKGPPFTRQISTLFAVTIFAAICLTAINAQNWSSTMGSWTAASYLSVKQIGMLFLGRDKDHYMLPFEIVGLLLLMALVGAVMVASKEDRPNG